MDNEITIKIKIENDEKQGKLERLINKVLIKFLKEKIKQINITVE